MPVEKVILEDLRKEFGSLTAVNDLNLKVPEGEFMALLGPSGCGKTTILKMIVGLLKPTSGKIYIDGKDETNVPPGEKDVGLVPQTYAIFPHMNVYNNIAYGLKIKKRNLPKNEIKFKVKKMADLLNLNDSLEKKSSQLRVDEMQRTALARSMITEPSVFLMDEPLSSLEASLRVSMRTELKRIHKELKQTIIYVTHDQLEAMTLADRISIMNFGVLQQCDTPENTYLKPASKFVAGFVGMPPINLLDVTLVAEGENIILDSGEFSLTINNLKEIIKKEPNSELILGARPEHVTVSDENVSNESIEGKVDIIEYLGERKLIHLSKGNITMTSLMPKDYSVSLHDKKWINFDKNKMIIMDKKTGISIF